MIKFEYIAAIGHYLKVEELPSGKGIADVVYLLKKKTLLPALGIELKWDKMAGGAIGTDQGEELFGGLEGLWR